MMKLFLLFVAAILVPPALSYGIDPAAILPKSMNITVEGTDQTEMLRAVMGLYLGMTIFCVIVAFTPAWRHVAAIWAVFFSTRSPPAASSASSSMASRAPSSCYTWRSSSSATRSGFSC
jgi:hypothetical protein